MIPHYKKNKKKLTIQILLNVQNTHPRSLKNKNQIADLVCGSPSCVLGTVGSFRCLSGNPVLQSIHFLTQFTSKSLSRWWFLQNLLPSAWIIF